MSPEVMWQDGGERRFISAGRVAPAFLPDRLRGMLRRGQNRRNGLARTAARPARRIGPTGGGPHGRALICVVAALDLETRVKIARR
jgi:hypothetical protein